MTFISDNQHFIKFNLGVAMRQLSPTERLEKYNLEFRSESRSRLKVGYNGLGNSLEKKERFYKEAFEVLGIYDFEFLLLSIYIDANSDQLLEKLRDDISKFDIEVLVSFKSLTFLFDAGLAKHKNSTTKGFLKHFFIESLDLTSRDWDTENENNNPVIYKVTEYLSESICSNDFNEIEISEVLLHFTRMWSMYYANPYNYYKAQILIHKLSELYFKKNPLQIKISLLEVIAKTSNLISTLLPNVEQNPLAELCMGSSSDSLGYTLPFKGSQPYYLKLEKFYDLLKEDLIFFADLGTYTLTEIFKGFCDGSERTKKAFMQEIERRKRLHVHASYMQINEFIVFRSRNKKMISDKSENKEFCMNISKCNYIFI